MYVEVLEVEHLHTSQVPGKVLENTIRFTRSEEDLPSLVTRTTGSPFPEFSVFGNFVHCDLDDAECWSQEDDEIIQVRGQRFSAKETKIAEGKQVVKNKIPPLLLE